MKIEGQIIEIHDTVQVSDKFKKREFVIQDNENPQYPQQIKFELAQDKCSLMDNHSVNDIINVSFNVRGRSYVNKQGVKTYFNQLQAWKIEAKGKAEAQPAEERYTETSSTPSLVDDGLPF